MAHVHLTCRRMKSIMHNTQMIKNGFALNFPCPQKNCPGKVGSCRVLAASPSLLHCTCSFGLL